MQEQSKFERGDKVRLRDGGPIMTVQAAPDHMAYCVWFVDAKPHEGTFHSGSLTLVMHAASVPDSKFSPLD